MIPQCFGLIRDMFGREMGKAFAAFGPAIGLATIIGPVVGGLLIEWNVFDLGWRTIFGKASRNASPTSSVKARWRSNSASSAHSRWS